MRVRVCMTHRVTGGACLGVSDLSWKVVKIHGICSRAM